MMLASISTCVGGRSSRRRVDSILAYSARVLHTSTELFSSSAMTPMFPRAATAGVDGVSRAPDAPVVAWPEPNLPERKPPNLLWLLPMAPVPSHKPSMTGLLLLLLLVGVGAKQKALDEGVAAAVAAGGGRRQAGRHAAVGRRAGGWRRAEDATEHGGQVARVHVLHLVDEQLRLGAVVRGLVQALDPAARLVEIGGPWRDDQNAVDALDGQHAHGAGQRQRHVVCRPGRRPTGG